MRRALAVLLAASIAVLQRSRGRQKRQGQRPKPQQTVDSGSFGVFIKGQRVATETFRIEQQNGASIIKSQLKETVRGRPQQREVRIWKSLPTANCCAMSGARPLAVPCRCFPTTIS